ncbi:MAG: 7-cyano-7-deazaguanine synthase [Phycisphaerales bacterium]
MSDTPAERALIIDDGSPCALVATLLEQAPEGITLWSMGAGDARASASRRRVALLGLAGVERIDAAMGLDDERTAGVESARLLLAAGAAAIRLGAARLVWPVALGDDLRAMGAAADRVRAVERLLDLETDPDTKPLRFDLPLLDLTLEQVADLAIDLDAPAEGAWWCEHEGAGPCGACPSCESWQRALQQARFGVAGTRAKAGA